MHEKPPCNPALMGVGLSVTGDSQWPFHPLVGGHLTLWRGHSIIPKTAQPQNSQVYILHHITLCPLNYTYKKLQPVIFWVVPPLQDFSGILSGVTLGSRWNPGGDDCILGFRGTNPWGSGVTNHWRHHPVEGWKILQRSLRFFFLGGGGCIF